METDKVIAELYTPDRVKRAMAEAKANGVPSVTIGTPAKGATADADTPKRARKVKADADTNNTSSN